MIVQLPIRSEQSLDVCPLLAEPTHFQSASKCTAGFDRKYVWHTERQVVATCPTHKVRAPIDELFLGLVHENVVLFSEYMTQIERVRDNTGLVAVSQGFYETYGEVRVSAPGIPVEVNFRSHEHCSYLSILVRSPRIESVQRLPNSSERINGRCWRPTNNSSSTLNVGTSNTPSLRRSSRSRSSCARPSLLRNLSNPAVGTSISVRSLRIPSDS